MDSTLLGKHHTGVPICHTHYGRARRWLFLLGLLLAGILLPQQAWAQGAIINDGLMVNKGNAPFPFIGFDDGTNTGELEVPSLTANQTWILPDASGTILLTNSAAGGDLTGTYANLTIVNGAVTTVKIANNAVTSPKIADDAVTSAKILDGTITNADISSTANIDVSKLAVTQHNLIVGAAGNVGSLLGPGNNGQVLMIVGGTPQWQTLSGTVPNGSADGQLLRWNNGSSAWEAVGLSSGTGISINNTSGGITITNTGDTNPGDDLTTGTTFSDAAASDATVSGAYNALNIQLKAGVVGTTEIADDAVTSAKIASNAVTSAKIADGTIATADIADDAVTSPKIASNAVTSAKIADGTIATADIADGAVTSAKIADGTITHADISSTANIGVSQIAVSPDHLIVGNAGGVGSLLGPGSAGDVLTIVGGVPTWQPPAAPSGVWVVGGNSVTTNPGILGTTSNHDLAISTNNTEAIRVLASNQYVGIGTTSPVSRLHVHGSAVRLTNSTTGSTATDGFVVRLNGSDVVFQQNENANIEFLTPPGSDSLKMQLTASGQLAFFSGTPGFRVDLPNNSANSVGRVRATGFATWSSIKWKEAVRPIPNALERVLALRGVNYRWKPQYGGGEDIGFIIEEVAPVVPEVVQRDERTGELLAMDYGRMTAVLVEALKQEHQRNEELRQEVAQLRQMVEQLMGQRAGDGSSLNIRVDGEWLGQNIPNPHDGTTTIPCYVPAGVAKAELLVSDGAGRLLRSVTLSARDTWTNVTLDMTLLTSGTYEYRLVFDGRIVATKQMQLLR